MRDELTLNELLDAVKQQLDPWYLLEILDLNFDDLVDALREEIENNYDKILDALE